MYVKGVLENISIFVLNVQSTLSIKIACCAGSTAFLSQQALKQCHCVYVFLLTALVTPLEHIIADSLWMHKVQVRHMSACICKKKESEG